MVQKNQDEFELPCGCISMNIEGFGWKTIMCQECEEEAEDQYFAPQKLGKFKEQYAN